MVEVGAVEAETQFSHLLDQVERGETVMITRDGRPVARLVPATAVSSDDRRHVIAQLKKLRQGQTLGGLSLRELIEEGRR